jgi:hypothetical protein
MVVRPFSPKVAHVVVKIVVNIRLMMELKSPYEGSSVRESAGGG